MPYQLGLLLHKWRRRRISKPHTLLYATIGVQSRCLAFRLTPPLRSLAEAGCLANPHGVLPLLVTFEVTPFLLGLRFHIEIEKDMAFLFRKVMSLEYDMDSDDYSLWLVTSSGSFADSTFLVPPVGALLSHHLLLYRTSIFRHSGLPSSLGFSATPTGEKCQQRDIVEIEQETRIIRHELAWHRHAKYVGSYVNL